MALLCSPKIYPYLCKQRHCVGFDANHFNSRIGDATEADTVMVCKSVQKHDDDILYSVESREVIHTYNLQYSYSWTNSAQLTTKLRLKLELPS